MMTLLFSTAVMLYILATSLTPSMMGQWRSSSGWWGNLSFFCLSAWFLSPDWFLMLLLALPEWVELWILYCSSCLITLVPGVLKTAFSTFFPQRFPWFFREHLLKLLYLYLMVHWPYHKGGQWQKGTLKLVVSEKSTLLLMVNEKNAH